MYRQAIAVSVGLWLYAPLVRPQLSPSALTADQLVEAAIARNRDFLSLKERITEAQGLLKQDGVGVADNLEVGGLAGQAFGTRGDDYLSLTYAHTFESFGKRGKRVAVARGEIALARAELDERRRTLAFDVKTRYAELAAEQQKLAVINRLCAVSREYLRLTEARVAKGDAAPLEANLLRVEMSREQSQRVLTEGRLRSAVLQLRAVLDSPGQDVGPISTSLIPQLFGDDLPRLKTMALLSRPDLRTLQVIEEQAAEQTVLAKVETKPNLTVFGQYAHTDTAFDQFGLTPSGGPTPIRDHVDSLGVGFSIPLTSARRNRGNVEAVMARQAGVKLRRSYLEDAIPMQVEAAYQRWRAAKEAADVLTQGVIEQSEKNLAVMRQAYTLGELRLLDILNEQRRLLDIELSYIDTQADLFRAYAELEQTVGGSLQ